MKTHCKSAPLPVGAPTVFMTSLSTSFLASGLISSSFPPPLTFPTVIMHTIQCLSLWREKITLIWSWLEWAEQDFRLGVMAQGEELCKPTPVLESCKGASTPRSTWAKHLCIAGCFGGGSGLHWGCYFQIWVHHLDVGAWAGGSSRLSLYFNTQNRHTPPRQAGSPVPPCQPTVLSSTCFSLTLFSLKENGDNYKGEVVLNSSLFCTMVLILASFSWKYLS